MEEDFKHIRLVVFKASRIKYLFEQLDNQPRPFELVVHPPICKTGIRPITIKATTEEDAGFFKIFLDKLSHESLDKSEHEADKINQ